MDLPKGKGFFIWKIQDCEGGDIDSIANLATQSGLSFIVIKIADQGRAYNEELAGPLVDALRRRGIACWGWHYIYGDQPALEAKIAVEQVRRLHLDGYVFNAEAEYAQPGKLDAARQFMRALNTGLPNTPLALSSYRFPSFHARLPWKAFLERADLVMPQVYWQGAHNSAAQLVHSLREFQGMVPVRPIVPIGAAYTALGWTPTAGEIQAFLQECQRLNLSGAGFWEWSAARHLGLWDTVAQYPWRDGSTERPFRDQFFMELNRKSSTDMLSCYARDAEHVSAAGTVRGAAEIQKWYSRLFASVLPGATFEMAGYSGADSSQHISWTAVSPAGIVSNGNDTFALKDGKISYHYTFFTVTNS